MNTTPIVSKVWRFRATLHDAGQVGEIFFNPAP